LFAQLSQTSEGHEEVGGNIYEHANSL
jgi:hypothetical protein